MTARGAEQAGPDEGAALGPIEIVPGRATDVVGVPVRRVLPRRARRTVGAWCFVDHMGPVELDEHRGVAIGPHPHLGLQTVTWLLAGEVLHRDSLGSEQLIRPGELNLMTAGSGVAHAEESLGHTRGELHGVQMWLAQPETTRMAAPSFEHHHDLPKVALEYGDATVLIGTFGETSPARRDTEHVGVDLDLGQGTSTLGLDPTYEYALVVLSGAVRVDGHHLVPGNLGYLGVGREELAVSVDGPTRALLVGGVPFPEQLLMWWNFVARTREEILTAYEQWRTGDGRFGAVNSPLAAMVAPPPVWL